MTTNEKLDFLPPEVLVEYARLSENEIIIYVTEKDERHILSRRPIDDEVDYQVILFDYST